MFGLGMGELLVVFVIALIFIGPKKLPELAKGLGQGLKEFQKATKGFTEQLSEQVDQVKKEVALETKTDIVETTAEKKEVVHQDPLSQNQDENQTDRKV